MTRSFTSGPSTWLLAAPALAAALVLSALLAAPARADIGCTSFSGGALTLVLTNDHSGSLVVDESGNIEQIGGAALPAGCDTATVTNTDSINVSGSGSQDIFTLDLAQPFAPGATLEASSSEIEIVVSLGTPSDDILGITGSTGADNITYGSTGIDRINLNAGEIGGADIGDFDLTPVNVDVFAADGEAGADTIVANGGAMTGTSPFGSAVGFAGGPGQDVLGTSPLFGGSVDGGSEDDSLLGYSANDGYFGSDGTDTAFFLGTAGVVASLLDHTATGQGSDTLDQVENLTGSPSGDKLTGDNLPNAIDGAAGDDLLIGRGGDDNLFGGLGFDIARGQAGTDICDAERAGGC